MIAQALGKMRSDAVWARARLIERNDYDGPKGSEMQSNVAAAIEGLQSYYARAAEAARAVIFTVDL